MTEVWRERLRAAVSLARPLLALAGVIVIVGVSVAASQPRAVVIVSGDELAEIDRAPDATIAGFEYHPPELKIKVGTTVVWINGDRFDHDVTVVGSRSPAPEDVRSALVNFNERIAMTFNEPGSYMYICSVHPFMQGSIIVEPADSLSD